jgi:competence protein ComEC
LLFDSGQHYDGRAFRDCLHEAQTHSVPIVRPQRGHRWTDDGVTLEILAPSLPVLADTGDDINENSIVAMMYYGDFRELFMGDAGESSEERLLASGIDLHAAALKVGHHGSQYASTPAFVAAVHPRVAIISVGRHNTFGHPAPSTLETLTAAGATVFRTDRCGALSFTEHRPLHVIPSLSRENADRSDCGAPRREAGG